MRKKFRDRLSLLTDLAGQLQQRLESGWPPECGNAIEAIGEQYAAAIAGDVSFAEVCDQLAQTFTCLVAAWQLLPPGMRQPQVRQWLVRQAHPIWRELLSAACCTDHDHPQPLFGSTSALSDLPALAAIRGGPNGWMEARRDIYLSDTSQNENENQNALAHLFEDFLSQYKSADRKRWGVFFTPIPIVQAMMDEVDGILKSSFQMSEGLAELASPSAMSGARILDPAAGSGIFLAVAIRAAYRDFSADYRDQNCSLFKSADWQHVVERLMPRLAGYELLLPGCALAQLVIAQELYFTGFQFQFDLPLNVVPHNTLAGTTCGTRLRVGLVNPTLSSSHDRLVIVGNPPFSGISTNDGPWVNDLLRGTAADDPNARSYFHVGGQPLGERKVWLNDDYVKFFRYAQWAVERAGDGLIAFVSNHAYLDNATFRGMRESLMKTFSEIRIVDLHGNLKRHERTPAGGADQNVFGIEQGVAIGYFVRSRTSDEHNVKRSDIWGTMSEKFTALASPDVTRWRTIHPVAPYFSFADQRSDNKQLPQGVPLDEFMPVYCTAPITARDHFIVAFDADELMDRLGEFADLSIEDAAIRQRYFQRTRSRRYAAGDTRGWNLSTARRRLAACQEPRANLRSCLYRPYDWRFVFWTDWMIDWPRPQVTEQADVVGNWFLITRRQMLPGAAANFFWVTRCIALDGVIRSDNRGSEALFPIYHTNDERPCANFCEKEIRVWSDHFQLAWLESGQGDLASTLGPEDVGDYLYALFSSSAYRTEYADRLCRGYPSVIRPKELSVLRTMVNLGRQLRQDHTFSNDETVAEPTPRFFSRSGDTAVSRGFPKFRANTIWINAAAGFEGVSEQVWSWAVGAHQVCRKWLSARRNRSLAPDDIAHYERMLESVTLTIETISQLDAAILEAGGLTKAFV